MIIFPVLAFMETVFKVLLALTSLFLIMLVLVQRGRGGGLAGALGGMGGSSAFGAKAGDVFTKVTVVAATFWILLCIAADVFGPSTETRIRTGTGAPAAHGIPADDEPLDVPADAPVGPSAPADTAPADEGAAAPPAGEATGAGAADEGAAGDDAPPDSP